MSYDAIQPGDDADADLAVSGHIKRKIEQHRREQDLKQESHVRQLIKLSDRALSGEVDVVPERVLMELHYSLRLDESLPKVLHPGSERLSQSDKIRFIRHARTRSDGEHPPALQEHQTAVEVAKSLGYLQSYRDKTRYAPIRLAPLESSEVDDVDDVLPFARRRVGAADSADLQQRAVDIDHSSSEHFLVIALPRKGKDSTACRIIGNLQEQHSYKAFSLYDDGRNETNMWAIPSDEPEMREILSRDFGQDPKAYQSRVFVPATGGLPDKLPANFSPFTIGIGDLTPKLLMRLASVDAGNADTERRLGIAIRDTIQEEGTVEGLIQRIHDYAEETEASISVTEMLGDDERQERSVSSDKISYSMDEDKYLQEIAKSLTMLAGDGLIGDLHQDTNLDLLNEFKHPERVAILNCNYLQPHNQYLKYVIINVWISLIMELRDDDTLRIPRAVLELRELKNLAPSTLSRARYSRIIKSLSQTIYEVATQGGSRRVLMVGSTQKLNDVLKAVRQMMPNKIILQVSEEEIQTLDNSLSFSRREEEQLKSFQPGWGMLVHDGDKHYPIQFCPARNGLGLGDENWKDRYGRAAGARVQEYQSLPEEAGCWIDMQGQQRDPEELEPGSWYLLPEDLDEHGSVEAALQERREYPLPQDLRLTDNNHSNTQREITLRSKDDADADRWDELQDEHNIPPVLRSWMDCSAAKRERYLEVLRAIESHELETQGDVANMVGLSKGAIGGYLSKQAELKSCVEGTSRGETLELTPVGHQAIQVDWKTVERELS